jgi:hypothetical protein
MRVKLTVGEIEQLKAARNRYRVRGGFQSLLQQLWYQLDEQSGEIELNYVLSERIPRYAFAYKSNSWRLTLRLVFRRTLGANLDRHTRCYAN